MSDNMKNLLIGLVVGAVVGVGAGHVLWNSEAAPEPEAAEDVEQGDRGEWPRVPSPPNASAEHMAMDLLQVIHDKALEAQRPDVVERVNEVIQEQHTPATWPPRSWNVFTAMQHATATPPNWDAVISELEPPD